jgi:8-oxo-dGTP diphosphatase
VVRAAGGIVVRRSTDGTPEIALVHRPGRRDWTLPKGKLEPGETPEQAALREVREETGFSCRLDAFVGTTRYLDSAGRPKVVDYWMMEPVGGRFVSGAEVDDMRWVSYPSACTLLTYPRDRELLGTLDGRLAASEDPGPHPGMARGC